MKTCRDQNRVCVPFEKSTSENRTNVALISEPQGCSRRKRFPVLSRHQSNIETWNSKRTRACRRGKRQDDLRVLTGNSRIGLSPGRLSIPHVTRRPDFLSTRI
jgi:hypothetical protein